MVQIAHYSSELPAQLIKHWKRTGQAKIAVKCESEEDLLILQATAKSLGICARSIQDAWVDWIALSIMDYKTNEYPIDQRSNSGCGRNDDGAGDRTCSSERDQSSDVAFETIVEWSVSVKTISIITQQYSV